MSRKRKLGRNDPCWCGSGSKYKKCHLGREEDKPLNMGEALNAIKKADKKLCLYPSSETDECKGGIINAHTIQRNGGLSRIAVDGHVYQFGVHLPDLNSGDESLGPKLVGIKNATTFTGFCSKHDTYIFKPIETQPVGDNEEQAFLLGYRSICKELYAKERQFDLIGITRQADRGESIFAQRAIQSTLDDYTRGVEAGLKDIKYIKTKMDNILQSGVFDNVLFYNTRFNEIPDFMCSGSILVEMDFAGNILQDFEEFGKIDKRLEYISFSLIGTDEGGLASFSFLEGNLLSIDFIRSLDNLSDELVPNAITRFTFEFFKNVVFSPTWWDSLPDEKKDSLRNRKKGGINLSKERNSNALVDDEIHFVNWSVSARNTNIDL